MYRIIARRLSQILPNMNLARNGKCAKNRILNKNVTAFIQQHWCTLAYICCVVLNTSLFLHPSMQGFPFWKSRGQLKIPYHSSSFLGKRLEIAMTRIFEKQKSGTRWENGNAVDSPDFFPSIPDDREYLQFLVFISRQNLGQSGNSKIPDCLVFSRHI